MTAKPSFSEYQSSIEHTLVIDQISPNAIIAESD
jgi:hypothetical protein